MNRKERRKQASAQRGSATTSAPMAGSLLSKHLNAALAARREARFEEAEEHFERALGVDGNHPLVLAEYALLLRVREQPREAIQALRKALRSSPNNPEILANLAVTLREVGEFDSALKAFGKSVEGKPDFAQAWSELAATYQLVENYAKSAETYQHSLSIDARQPASLANLGLVHLQLGDPAKALEACERCFKLDPHSMQATAVKAYSLHEVGQEEQAKALMGLDRLVLPIHLESVEGFESMERFHQALEQHLRSHRSLQFEPNQRTTVNGQQTGELLRGDKGPIEPLEKELNSAVEQYLAQLPEEADHPYLCTRPLRWQMSLWGTILGEQGHQSPHFHPAAWVSAVYYVKVPKEVTEAGDGQEGWLEFGQAPPEFHVKKSFPTRRIQPEEGLVVLFPSYLYHGTIPFSSDEARISIAMDAVRRG